MMNVHSLSTMHPLCVVAHQPNLFPRLKILHKIAHGNIWIILDDVQYAAREWQNRARVRPLNQPERAFWITIPVHRPYGQGTLVRDVEVDDQQDWKGNLFRSLYHAYCRSQHWLWIEQYATAVLDTKSNSLCRISVNSIIICLDRLGLTPSVEYSSTLNIQSTRSNRIVEICQRLGSTCYLSGSGGLRYLDISAFTSTGISIVWQLWPFKNHEYLFTDGLEWINISFIDFVARYGPRALARHLATPNHHIEP